MDEEQAATAVRQWLAEAWRHGEVIADDEVILVPTPPRPVDRFHEAAAAGEVPPTPQVEQHPSA